jgi:hypothetical protein
VNRFGSIGFLFVRTTECRPPGRRTGVFSRDFQNLIIPAILAPIVKSIEAMTPIRFAASIVLGIAACGTEGNASASVFRDIVRRYLECVERGDLIGSND